jgi:HD-GYP domain-containing protein (c-di-GMP phosphodiesterase class II)
MADNLKIAGAGEVGKENLEEFGREYSDKLQAMGKTLLSSLYMLMRSVKMYDPENDVFDKPLATLQDVINQIVAKDGRLELQGVKDTFYLNNMLIRMDVSALESVRFLIAEFQAKDVGGFSLVRPVSPQELRNFIWIFSKEQSDQPEEDGVKGRKLIAMKVSRWSKIKEKLEKDNLENPDDQKVDRKKYAMTVYARAVVFVREYVKEMREGKNCPHGPIFRIVQDLVDICFQQRTHFLGMTTFKEESEYLIYHQVNSCLMAIVFGNELGLDKPQLRDLGLIGIFHEMGTARLPPAVLNKKGALSAEEKAEMAKGPYETIRQILNERSASKAAMMRLVATNEYRREFGKAVKDRDGNVQMIVPSGDLNLYSRILAIASTYDALTSKRPYRDAYGPEIALTLMWTEIRHKFDPDLLKVFMNVMAIQPIKVLKRHRGTVSVSGV